MKIFISWSGETSQAFAMALAEWLPMVIQSVKPFMSTNAIRSGQRWSNEIGKQLEGNSFGIICLTPDNTEAPWIHFEAGALSKFLGNSAVVPLRIGIENVDIPGPLAQFQGKGLSQEDMLALILDIHSLMDSDVEIPVLRKTFEKFWPELEPAIKSAHEALKHGRVAPAKRSTEGMIEETLNTVRALAGNVEDMKSQLMTQFAHMDARGLGALAGIESFHSITPKTGVSGTRQGQSRLGEILKAKIAEDAAAQLNALAKGKKEGEG